LNPKRRGNVTVSTKWIIDCHAVLTKKGVIQYMWHFSPEHPY